jgi:hypothetical protein
MKPLFKPNATKSRDSLDAHFLYRTLRREHGEKEGFQAVELQRRWNVVLSRAAQLNYASAATFQAALPSWHCYFHYRTLVFLIWTEEVDLEFVGTQNRGTIELPCAS